MVGKELYQLTYKEIVENEDLARMLVEGSCVKSGHPMWAWEGARKFIASQITEDGDILDIGCANGFLLRCLQEWSGKKLNPYGVDHEEKYLADAKKLFKEQDQFVKALFADIQSNYPANFPNEFKYIYWGVWVNYKVTKEDFDFLFKHLTADGKLILGFYPDSGGDPVDLIGNIQRIRDFGISFIEINNPEEKRTEKILVFKKPTN